MQANESGDKTSAAAKEAHAKSQAKTSDLYSQAHDVAQDSYNQAADTIGGVKQGLSDKVRLGLVGAGFALCSSCCSPREGLPKLRTCEVCLFWQVGSAQHSGQVLYQDAKQQASEYAGTAQQKAYSAVDDANANMASTHDKTASKACVPPYPLLASDCDI